MKIFAKIIVLQLLFAHNSFADTFTIKGKTTGKVTYNYAYLFIQSGKLIESVRIVDQAFLFQGEIDYKQRFGELPIVNILLSNKPLTMDEIESKRLLSKRKHDRCTVILEKDIDVLYDTDRKVFTIKGGPLNEVQSLYEHQYAGFRNKTDSIFGSVNKDGSPKQADEKELEAKRLFTKTMYNFIDIVKKHPDSKAALFNFFPIILDQGITAKEVADAFNLFSQPLKESEYGKYVYKDVVDKIKAEEILKKPAYTVGMKMPSFSAANDKGDAINSESQYAKYTLIDFWATWCVPCRKETPNIINAFDSYNQKGFQVITVSIDDLKDKQQWADALKKDHMDKFVNLFNGGDISGIARELKVVAIPANYLVDSNGTIVATNLRGGELTTKLQELLSK